MVWEAGQCSRGPLPEARPRQGAGTEVAVRLQWRRAGVMPVFAGWVPGVGGSGPLHPSWGPGQGSLPALSQGAMDPWAAAA